MMIDAAKDVGLSDFEADIATEEYEQELLEDYNR